MNQSKINNERKIYQLHKKGYSDITEAIKKKESEFNLNLKVEVNGAIVKDIKLEEDEE